MPLQGSLEGVCEFCCPYELADGEGVDLDDYVCIE